MNIGLLKKVEQKLRRMRHTDHFSMEDWAHRNECGTTACIAGHALLMEGFNIPKTQTDSLPGVQRFISPDGKTLRPMPTARKLLDLTERQAERLFFAQDWPEQFKENCNDPKVAANRVKHFIETKGKE